MPISENSDTQTATVASGATTSDTLVLGGYTLAGIQLPDTITGTSLTFEVSARGVEFVPLEIVADDGTVATATITVAAGKGYSLPFSWFTQWNYVKLVFGSAQAAEREIDVAIVAV